jgi:acetyl-CoA acetyltransferase family protein
MTQHGVSPREAVIAAYVRSPIGRYGGALADVRPDTLAATTIRALLERAKIDPAEVDDVILGCANQAGEDNRNVARMALLLAGLPVEVPGQTVNRLCGSGLQAINAAAQAIWSGQGDVFIAGGVESMTRAPLVMLKPEAAYPRGVPPMADSTLGWRFPHPDLERGISRQDQDTLALLSQQKTGRAIDSGRLADEIVGVSVPRPKSEPLVIDKDEHPRPNTTAEALGKLRPAFTKDGTVTAGNSSGINDGAAALLVTTAERARSLGIEPLARIVSTAVAGVKPDEMGLGPIPASRKALARADLGVHDMAIVEVNEAFASQVIASLEDLGVDWRDEQRVNPNGGAIALGHPLGASGARLAGTASMQLRRTAARYALVTMCIGVGQGIATIFEHP